MKSKIIERERYVFRQYIPSDAIGLPINSKSSIESAESTLRRLGFEKDVYDDTLNWVKELSVANRGSGQVCGQLRLEKLGEGALAVLLRASLQDESESNSGIDQTDFVGASELVENLLSPIDNSEVSIFGNLLLGPSDHIIYDTRWCKLRGLPGGAVCVYRAQTSSLSIGSQMTTIFRNWVQTCEWTLLEAENSK